MINISNLQGVHFPLVASWTVFGSKEAFLKLPEEQRKQILFLNGSSTQAVYDAFNCKDILCGDDGWGNTPFSAGCFESVEKFCIQEYSDLNTWLLQHNVSLLANVLLLPVFASADEPAVLTVWQIVVEFASELFSGDNIVVADVNAHWCLHYHHDGIITFAHTPA